MATVGWAILKNTDSNLFVTGFYLVADAARSRMLYANAGHPEPLLLHRLRGELESFSPPMAAADRHLAYLMTPNTGPASVQWPWMILSCSLRMASSKREAPDDKNQHSRAASTDGCSARARQVAVQPGLLFKSLANTRQFSKRSEFSDDVCLVGMDVTRLCND